MMLPRGPVLLIGVLQCKHRYKYRYKYKYKYRYGLTNLQCKHCNSTKWTSGLVLLWQYTSELYTSIYTGLLEYLGDITLHWRVTLGGRGVVSILVEKKLPPDYYSGEKNIADTSGQIWWDCCSNNMLLLLHNSQTFAQIWCGVGDTSHGETDCTKWGNCSKSVM